MRESKVRTRLRDLGMLLPEAPQPAAAYSPWHRSKGIVTVAGQPPYRNGLPAFTGKLGADLTLEEGKMSARISALNILAHLENACDGDLDHVTGCVRMLVLVHATADFFDVHKVADGASELIAQAFPELGPPPRSSLGCVSLPMNIATEVEAQFTVRS